MRMILKIQSLGVVSWSSQQDWDIESQVRSALTKIASDKKGAIPKLTGDDFALVVGWGLQVPNRRRCNCKGVDGELLQASSPIPLCLA
jgi:hypothetical protein